MNAQLKLSIFTEVDVEGLPVKPVRTERTFTVQDLPKLSAESIQSRIDHLMRREADSATPPDSEVSSTASTDETVSVASIKLDELLNVRKAPEPLFFTSTFAPVQEWEGYVRAIGPESISADLVDMTANERKITEVAEIPLDELSDNDRAKLRLGGIFRWSIGYQRTPRGTKMRVSNIVFRDLPRWTDKDLREAKEKASKLREYFKPGRPEFPSETDAAQS
jgi:hypothetical protein